jgi:hypothetical protein
MTYKIKTNAEGLCPGNTKDHCCYVNGVRCPFLEENTVEGRRWACGLRRKLGSWEKVHQDKGYLTLVKPHWENAHGIMENYNCGDWPPPGVPCPTCGVTG